MAAWQKVGIGITALVVPLCMVAEGGIADELAADDDASTHFEVQAVPPNGWDNFNETEFRYFQTMGPLEYATRLSGIPTTPAWRIRLQLYPLYIQSDFAYGVRVDHFNLSPALYQEVSSNYGVVNTDPSLNDQTTHQHIEMTFVPIMGIAAELIPEFTLFSHSSVASNPLCAEGLGCASLRYGDAAEWASDSTIQLEAAPWETEIEPVFAMTRTLAKQAGWLQTNNGYDQWNHGEIPEGSSAERPWVEVFVENYIGNGGVYFAEWTERVADDSVSAIVHRVYYFPNAEGEAQAYTGYICARGEDAGKIRSICP